jgi:hypothetical protein
MYYTKEQLLEKAMLEFLNRTMTVALDVTNDLNKSGKHKEAQAFATGIACMTDAMHHILMPKLQELIKEDTGRFECNN